MNMQSNELISIIIPALNESENFEELYERTKRVMNSIGRKFEFIVIDDGSNDGSYEKLLKMKVDHSNIGVVRHRKNHGKSMALMQGFAVAKGEIAITMDADLQDEPENIPAMLDKMSEGYDLVNGWRVNRKDKMSKRWVSKLFNAITGRILKTNVHDINCGFKCMRKPLYKKLELRGDLHRLIPVLANSYGHSVAEVEVAHAERKHGNTKYKLLRHRGLFDIIALMTTMTTKLRPFHVFCEMALVVWFFFVLAVGGIVALTTIYPYEPSFAYNILLITMAAIAMVLMFAGIVLPITGILIDVLSAPFQGASWRKELIGEIVEADVPS